MAAYVARQPIFDHRKKISGYELLFRDRMAKYNPSVDGDVATSTVLSNSYFSIGMESLVGDKRSFINFTQSLLLQKLPLLLPTQSTVIEILEDVNPTEELVTACQEMAKQGYHFALDDFIYTPKLQPLIELANIIKFDFRLSSMDEIHCYLKKIRRRDDLIILAEKVETYDEYQRAIEMGFNLFQGFFFCKPQLISGKEIPGSQIALLQIMAEVNQPDFKIEKIEALISPDVSLSYKLLRYINSAFFSTAQRISSIQQALVYLGESEIRRFVSLVAMSNLAEGKPGELIRASCIRGKFCELIGGYVKERATGSELFTLGMFSLIDAILDHPMGKVMNALPLSEDIKTALVERKGRLSGYLFLAETYEKGQWPQMAKICRVMDIDEQKLPELYQQACQWSNTFSNPS
ncbi:MAG: HDOD domain-containing protein [Desulfobacteraceae bacterium]|jgi:EAL and modified HD-GYP domain-containing signal transduction protein